MFDTEYIFWSNTIACMIYDNAWLIVLIGIIGSLIFMLFTIRKIREANKNEIKKYLIIFFSIIAGSLLTACLTMIVMRIIFYQPNYKQYKIEQETISKHIEMHKKYMNETPSILLERDGGK